jgi:hypothetical protein
MPSWDYLHQLPRRQAERVDYYCPHYGCTTTARAKDLNPRCPKHPRTPMRRSRKRTTNQKGR